MVDPEPVRVDRAPVDSDPSPRPARRRRRWAEHELGELLGRAWSDDATPAGHRPVASPGRWEVEAIPSEADGGVVSLLLNGSAAPIPETGPDPYGPDSYGPDRERAESDGPSGRAQLNHMIDHLPAEPYQRVTPDDVDVDDPDLAPPVVWFWGDDDIYPGKLPGGAQPVASRRRRQR